MNYKHLQYFMEVARLGSVTRASERLHLAPQTISGQIQLLEERLGSSLFAKSGRGLVLTDAGRLALDYAQQIFSLGGELQQAVREHESSGRAVEFRIGVADAVPKAIAYRLVMPATEAVQSVRIVCREGKLDSLLAELALHRIDLVIAEAPIPPSVSVRAFGHRLGTSDVTFFAAPALHGRHAKRFPGSLEGAPLLMPGEDSALGRRLRAWLGSSSLRPSVVGEFDDSALAYEFGRRGAGIFVGPTVLAREIETQFKVKSLGSVPEVVEEFFAISVERRITHPCVVAITQSARSRLFTAPQRRRARR